ncbi:MAG: GIY-YIG nuclease family protein [Desulfovibrionaceae bacterium]
MPDAPWYVYLLRCADDSLYCGVTTDLERRLAEHNAGTGARYTRARRPVALAGAARAAGRSEALRLEAAIKRLPRNRKLARLAAEAKAGGAAARDPE